MEQRSLLANQRRFFLQRAESSMYSLSRTIKNFGDRIRKMQGRLKLISPDADGLKEFLLTHYQLESDKKENLEDCQDDYTPEVWDDDYEEEKEEETEAEKQKTRQKLRRSIETNTDKLRDNPDSAQKKFIIGC